MYEIDDDELAARFIPILSEWDGGDCNDLAVDLARVCKQYCTESDAALAEIINIVLADCGATIEAAGIGAALVRVRARLVEWRRTANMAENAQTHA